MVMAEQENGAKRGRKDAERREMRKRGERGGKQLRAEQSRRDRFSMCLFLCVAFIYHANKRFLVRHEKQIAHSRSVIHASPLGLGCICTFTRAHTLTRKVLIHTHTVHAHTNRVYASPVSRRGAV